MAVTFAPGTDFVDVTDGLEAVTLNRRGSSSDVSVASALQRNVSTTEIAESDGKYRAGDVRWHLPISQVANTPQLGDSIVDSNLDRWKVIEVRFDTLSTRWHCVTRNLAIAYGLNDTIVIEAATWAKGTGGAMEATYSIWKSGVRARIQEVSDATERARIQTEEGAKRTPKQFKIYVDKDYEITHTHRIRDRKGTYYKVEGNTTKGELDEMQIVEASEWR